MGKGTFFSKKKKACAIILDLTFYFSVCSSPIQDAPLIVRAEEIKRELLPVLYLSNHDTKLLLEELQNLESLERIRQNIFNQREDVKKHIKTTVTGILFLGQIPSRPFSLG